MAGVLISCHLMRCSSIGGKTWGKKEVSLSMLWKTRELCQRRTATQSGPKESVKLAWKDVEEKGGEFVNAVEDEGIVPEEDGDAERSEGEREVGVEPGEVVGEEEGLRHARDVDQVAEVEHEELILVA